MKRKDFLMNLIDAFIGTDREEEQRIFNNVDIGDFFSSYDKCYALFAEIPMEDLVEAARDKGIETEGMSKLEIAKAVFSDKSDRTAQGKSAV